MTDQPTGSQADPRSRAEREFLQRWRPLIDRVGGDGGQARAAKHLNWTTSTVSRDYKGDTLPTDKRLHQLCRALQLSPNETVDLTLLLRRARSARRDRARDPGDQARDLGDRARDPGDLGDQARDLGDQMAGGDEAGRPFDADPVAEPGPAGPGYATWLRGTRGRVVAAVIAGAAVVMIAVAFVLAGSGAPLPVKPAVKTKPAAGSQPAVKGGFPGLSLDAVQIPVASLSPSLAAAFRRGRTAHDATVKGYVFRNREDPGLCLTAVNSGPEAGLNHDPVLVLSCRRAANEIWIPEQWQTKGFRFTHLVNDQYQGMCLNADNIGGLQNRHVVQLWNCYPAGNEAWDFGDWYKAVSSQAKSYPLFVESGRLCLDADRDDLRIGTPVHIWTQYAAANQFWS